MVNEVVATGYAFDEKDKDTNPEQYFSQIWELESKVVEQSSETGENIAKEIKVLKVYKEGKLNLYVNGDEAIYNKDRGELRMKGHVHLESADGSTKMDTELLIWQDSQKEFSCPQPIDVWIENNHVLADMIFADKDMERIDFLGRVSMYITGIQKENLLTREGYIDLEDVKSEGKRNPDDVINVECGYMHYDKTEKSMGCYPEVPHTIHKKYQLYLREEEYQPKVPLKFQGGAAAGRDEKPEEIKPGEKYVPESAKSTGLEGFEGVFNKGLKNEKKPLTSQNGVGLINAAPSETKTPKQESASKPVEVKKEEGKKASPDEEPFPGKFPDRLARQVYCWKQNKKIFSNRLDIDLKKNTMKPRFDVYIWAFNFSSEAKKKYEKQKEEPSKTIKALAKDTSEIYGDFMNVYWKTDFIEAWGGIEVRQKEKFFKCDNMVYSDELAVLQADGNVYMDQLDGKWLDREGLLEDVTDEKAKEDAKKPMEIWSDAMISYDQKHYVYMTGDVYLKQKTQNAIADEAEFSDDDDMLILKGNVRYRNKDGERIDADRMTIYTEKNLYLAEGAVEGRALIPEKYEKELKKVEEDKGKKPAKSTNKDKEAKSSGD